MLQLTWNVQLGRVQPLPPHDRLDWLLVLATVAAAAAYGALSAAQTAAPSWSVAVTGIAMLLPYTGVQLRMMNRSRRAEVLAQMDRLVHARPVVPPYLLARQRFSRANAVIVTERAA